MNGESSSSINNQTNFHVITEGKAKMMCVGEKSAFYNPVQEFNRDLTICVLRQFLQNRSDEFLCSDDGAPPIKRPKASGKANEASVRVLDALSASGLRALRFAKEVPGIDYILANDFSEDAVESIKRNIQVNEVENIVDASLGDAIDAMMANRTYDKRFYAIDLDPYGSPSVFLDSAVQAVADDGLLMVTCTDMATLCGNCPEACFNKYQSIPLRTKSCHEFALRMLIRAIDAHANRYGRYVVPLVCVSVDFYIRCFVQIKTSPVAAKESALKLSHVLSCYSCHSLAFQPLFKKVVNGISVKFIPSIVSSSDLIVNSFKNEMKSADELNKNNETILNTSGHCIHCGSKAVHMGGPIYTTPIQNSNFVAQLIERLKETPVEDQLGTHDRLLGVLTVISEEIHDVPLYYEYADLMSLAKCQIPKLVTIRSAILNGGYRCSISHANPKSLKTDAPVTFLWDICRKLAKVQGIKTHNERYKEATKFILTKKSTFDINFNVNRKALEIGSINEHLTRFQINKGKNWGPKSKAKGSVDSTNAMFKSRVELKEEQCEKNS